MSRSFLPLSSITAIIMRLFVNFLRSGSRHAFTQFQKGVSLFKGRQVNFILVDPEEEEEEDPMESTMLSEDCSLYAEINIPSTFHSDTPLSITCPSSNFLDLRATYPSLPLPMGVSNGPEICVGASFKGYLATLLVPCILLVLGSYIFVAAMAYVYHKSKGLDAVSEPPVEDAGIQETPSCDKFISGTPLPTPEEVLESTLKQYGHLSDSDKVETTSQSPPRPNLEPKAITLDQKSLKNTVRRDVAIMFRGTVPDSWVAEQHGPRETRSAPWTSSAHTTAMNVIEVGTPIVRIPTRSLTASSIPIQRNDILWHPIGVGVAVRPGMMLQTTARNRPALITTNTHQLAAMQHQCFSSSPLRYNYTITSPRPPQLRVQVPASPTLPMGMPRKNIWAPSG